MVNGPRLPCSFFCESMKAGKVSHHCETSIHLPFTDEWMLKMFSHLFPSIWEACCCFSFTLDSRVPFWGIIRTGNFHRLADKKHLGYTALLPIKYLNVALRGSSEWPCNINIVSAHIIKQWHIVRKVLHVNSPSWIVWAAKSSWTAPHSDGLMVNW